MRAPDWTLFQSLLAVVDAGGLSAAARRLGVSQPTLSRQIAALEENLGVVLFERSGRGLAPSAMALQVAEEARRMRAAADAIGAAVARETRGMAGVVRVTASEIVACFALPEVLTSFVEEHPEVQIEVDATNEVSDLLARKADIAIRMTRPAQPGLIARRLADVPGGIYASRSYLARHAPPQRLEDLRTHRLVGYDASMLILRAAKRAKFALAREDFAFRCDHQIACWRMVQAGFGIGVVARFVGDADPGAVRILPKIPAPPMQMWLVARADLRTTPRLRAAYDWLASRLPAATAGSPA